MARPAKKLEVLVIVNVPMVWLGGRHVVLQTLDIVGVALFLLRQNLPKDLHLLLLHLSAATI